MIPAAADAAASTLLPDMDMFPQAACDYDGLTVEQRKFVFETLELILDVFGDPGYHGRGAGGGVQKMSLPRTSMACIAAQIAALFEQLHLLHPEVGVTSGRKLPGLGQLSNGNDVDLGCLVNSHGKSFRHAGNPLTKQGLIAELQTCRRQMLDLEGEKVSTRRTADAALQRGRRDAEKTVSRLLAVNHALEQKHKIRVEEARKNTQKCRDLEARAKHYEWLLAEKTKTTKLLEDELSKSMRRQEDVLTREKELANKCSSFMLLDTKDCKRIHIA